jgi:RND family efflux transporter MFP subunit
MNYETGSIGADGTLALPGGNGTAGRRRRWWIAGAVLLLLALTSQWIFMRPGAKPDAADSGDAKSQIPPVTVAIPGRVAVARTLSATGSLAARVDMPVGVVGEGGMVTRVLVQPGDRVRAGQLLASVDRSVQTQTAESQAAQLRVAEADAKIAQAELDRARQLVDRGFISKADLERKEATRDSALARVRVAAAQLSEIRARNGRLDIRAPAAGLVLTRNVEPGQVVGGGSGTLFRIARDAELELRAALSETDLAQVTVGDTAQVTPVGSQQHFTGRIWQVSPVIDPQTRQGFARIALGYDPALRPGGFAAAEIVAGTSQSPLLPQSAIQSDDKGNYVYVVNARDEVVRQSIKVGQVSDAGVSVVAGLTGNERVVVSAGAFLNPGQKIKPVLQRKAS